TQTRDPARPVLLACTAYPRAYRSRGHAVGQRSGDPRHDGPPTRRRGAYRAPQPQVFANMEEQPQQRQRTHLAPRADRHHLRTTSEIATGADAITVMGGLG